MVAGLARRDAPRRVPLRCETPALVLEALTVLFDRREALAADAPGAPVARTELAARTAYDAHALDPDRRLSTAVLRALAARAGLPRPPTPPAGESSGRVRVFWWTPCRRRVWSGTSSPTRRLRVRPERRPKAAARHLVGPGHGLAPTNGNGCWSARTPRAGSGGQLDPDGAGVVCTMGRPDLVTQADSGPRAGCALAYHGDFDWPDRHGDAAQARFGASSSDVCHRLPRCARVWHCAVRRWSRGGIRSWCGYAWSGSCRSRGGGSTPNLGGVGPNR